MQEHSCSPRSRLQDLTIACIVGNLVAALFLASLPSLSHAEGSAEVGVTQGLRAQTELYIDVLDPSHERIRWEGYGDATVYDPSSQLVGSYASGSLIVPASGPGAYRIELVEDQVGGSWDLAILDSASTPQPGRLFSTDWQFSPGSYGEEAGGTYSTYALLAGGGGMEGRDIVIELKMEGLASPDYQLLANQTGPRTTYGQTLFRSVPEAGHVLDPQFPLYLNIPQVAIISLLYPTLSISSVSPSLITPGVDSLEVVFQSDVNGTVVLVADVNGDGAFDVVDPEEVLARADAIIGNNTLKWGGRDSFGEPLVPGIYDLRLTLRVGEFHHIAPDIETSYPGLRLFMIDFGGGRSPLRMYWNDVVVQAGAVTMPNGQIGLESSGPYGVYSGSYSDDAVPNVNSRAWGNFSGIGKGDNALLNTFAWVNSDVASTFEVEIGAWAAVDASPRRAAPHLNPSSPHPCRGGTRVSYVLGEPNQINLQVYDLAGRLVATLRDGVLESSGVHEITWNGRGDRGESLAPGVYALRLEAGRTSVTQKLVLLK